MTLPLSKYLVCCPGSSLCQPKYQAVAWRLSCCRVSFERIWMIYSRAEKWASFLNLESLGILTYRLTRKRLKICELPFARDCSIDNMVKHCALKFLTVVLATCLNFSLINLGCQQRRSFGQRVRLTWSAFRNSSTWCQTQLCCSHLISQVSPKISVKGAPFFLVFSKVMY